MQINIEGIRQAAASTRFVSGLTHRFYRYPARFSPELAHACISSLTSPGDLVLDPFMGGGTTLVESLALGRYSVGTDISSLATFISTVKTTLLSCNDKKILNSWINSIPNEVLLNRTTKYENTGHGVNYHRNITTKNIWRIRKAINLSIESLHALDNDKQKDFARCVILNTAQWALNCRREIPSVDEFRSKLRFLYQEMVTGEYSLHSSVKERYTYPIRSATKMVKCINKAADCLRQNELLGKFKSPKLILTSPPYPGMHILYHRWQILGRRETAAPFWIANKPDGAGESYYTLGSRSQDGLNDYFRNLTNSFKNLAKLATKKTIFVQVLAFSEPEWQLTKYLECMEEAGLTEVDQSMLKATSNSRIWRQVPQRKWQAHINENANGGKEVILLHRIQ